MDVEVRLATKKDRKALDMFFEYYGSKELTRNRSDCYTSHNFTVVAVEDKKIVGMLQWRVKEDPHLGAVEFEEINICSEFNNKKLGKTLVEFGIKSAKEYFQKLGLRLRVIYLFVSEKNLVARKLYESFKFKKAANLGKLFCESKNELFYLLRLAK